MVGDALVQVRDGIGARDWRFGAVSRGPRGAGDRHKCAVHRGISIRRPLRRPYSAAGLSAKRSGAGRDVARRRECGTAYAQGNPAWASPLVSGEANFGKMHKRQCRRLMASISRGPPHFLRYYQSILRQATLNVPRVGRSETLAPKIPLPFNISSISDRNTKRIVELDDSARGLDCITVQPVLNLLRQLSPEFRASQSSQHMHTFAEAIQRPTPLPVLTHDSPHVLPHHRRWFSTHVRKPPSSAHLTSTSRSPPRLGSFSRTPEPLTLAYPARATEGPPR